MNKIKNILFYGGLDKEMYTNIRPRISQDNRKSVGIFTLIGALAFVVAAVVAMIADMSVPYGVYFVGAGVFFVMLLLNLLLSKKFPRISDTLALVYSTILLGSGILISYGQSDERTAMLWPLFLLVALVFCYRPIYLLGMLVTAETVYLCLMSGVETDTLFVANAGNSVIFSAIGIVAGSFSLQTKYKKYSAEYSGRVLLERDVLTGLYNRLSCREALKEFAKKQRPVIICSMDVNELKQTNDTLGHLAGDELLRGAAQCIRDVFGKYGEVYRTGGDEFCALIYQDVDQEALLREFNERTEAWKGEKADKLTVAVGMAKLDYDYEKRLVEVIHEADQRMYADKRVYHETYGK